MNEGRIYHKGRWVPRSHFYDYGEEPVYLGPPRARVISRHLSDLIGCVVGCPFYAFVFWEIFSR
jgi:hypothetical protein